MIITKQKFKFQSYLYYVLLENVFFRLCYINIERYKIPRGDKKVLMEYRMSYFDERTKIYLPTLRI